MPVVDHLGDEHALGLARSVSVELHAEVAEDLELGHVPERL